MTMNEYAPMATVLNDKIQNHLFECVDCNNAITLNVAKVQILMQGIINDYGYYGYMPPDNRRLFERANNVLRKRIHRTHN